MRSRRSALRAAVPKVPARLGAALLGPVLLLALTSCTATPAVAEHAAPAGKAAVTASHVPAGRLLFRRTINGSDTLITSTTDGAQEKQVTQPAAGVGDANPNWSPDGSHIVFTRNANDETPGETHRVYSVDADGSGLKQLTAGKFDGAPAISPDGKSIAYLHAGGHVKNQQLEHSDLAIMSADGTHQHVITHHAAYGGDMGGVAWSPDGRELAYAYNDVTDDSRGSALFIVGVDGKGDHRITDWKDGANGFIDWAPRGDLIAFRTLTSADNSIGNVFTIHPDGSGPRQVTHFKGRRVGSKMSFSPDGQWIGFAAAADGLTGQEDLYLVKVDGSGLHLVKKTPLDEGGADWRPGV